MITHDVLLFLGAFLQPWSYMPSLHLRYAFSLKFAGGMEQYLSLPNSFTSLHSLQASQCLGGLAKSLYARLQVVLRVAGLEDSFRY